MADLIILDTGFLRTDNLGTQLATTARANSGNTITLHAVSFAPQSSANLDDTPEVGTYSESEVNFASFNNGKFTINGMLDSKSATDIALIYQLWMLPRTKGYKLIYYNSVGSDASKQLIYELGRDAEGTAHTLTAGEQSLFSISGAYRHIHVRFESFIPVQSANSSLISFSLTGIFEKVRSSEI